MRNLIGAVRQRLREARRRDRQLFRLRLLLGTALVVTLAIVVTGDPSEGVPERLAEGTPLRGIDYWRTYGWWVALANSAVLGILWVTAPRWFECGPVVESRELAPPRRLGAAFVLLVAGAMLAGALLAAPRLCQSFWDDEEYNLARAIDGAYSVDDSGEVRFDEARWRDTLWYYKIPNNHVAHTILARISLHTWQALSQPKTGFASEPAVRLPAFLAGLASIASIALLLHRLGHPAAGVFAAWLLAVHPWHFRYASEARGYSIAMLGVTASLILLLRALQRGSWSRWALFGLCQFLLLWTYPGLVWHLLIANGVALAGLWRLHGGTPRLRQQGVRWAAANLFGALAWIQLMAPNLAQLPAYLATTRGNRDLGAPWLASVGSHLFAGMPWSRHADPIYPELADVVQQAPVIVWTLVIVALVWIVAGAARLLAAGGTRALLPAVFLVPAPLTYVLGWLRGDNLYVWYMVFALPSLVLLLALGSFALVPRRLGPRWSGALAGAAAVAFLGAHFWLTDPARTALRSRSFKPGRESVALARATLDPRAPENRRVLTVQYRDWIPLYYDPRMQWVRTADELREAMRRAERDGLELFANFGRLDRIRRYQPELLALVDDPGHFERLAVLHGFEPPWTRAVYRYRGESERDARDSQGAQESALRR